MKYITFSVLALLFSSVIGVNVASAQEASPPLRRFETVDEKVEKMQEVRKQAVEKREEAQDQRCTRVTGAIEKRVSQYETHANRRIEVYQKIVATLTKTLDSLDDANVDTADARKKLKEFDSLAKEFTTKSQAAQAALVKTQGFACGESQGQFKAALETSKTAFEEARVAARTAHEYFVKVVRPELQELRENAKQSKVSNVEDKE